MGVMPLKYSTDQPPSYTRDDSVLMETSSNNKTGREHKIYYYFYLKPVSTNIIQEHRHCD